MSLLHVGVGSFHLHMNRPNRWLRRYALFFDRFDIIDLDSCLHQHRTSAHGKQETISECGWLIERGLLRQVPHLVLLSEGQSTRTAELDRLLKEKNRAYHDAEEHYRSFFKDPTGFQEVPPAAMKHLNEMVSLAGEMSLAHSERAAIIIRSTGQALATSLEQSRPALPQGLDEKLDAASLLCFAIKDVPVPATTTPWTEIQKFKEDEDTLARLRGLRSWLTSTARGGISLAEAADRIDDELSRYRAHLKGAGLRMQQGTLEALLKAGLITGGVDISVWNEQAAKPFALTQLTAHSRQEEMAAPGRELSYLVKVEEAGL